MMPPRLERERTARVMIRAVPPFARAGSELTRRSVLMSTDSRRWQRDICSVRTSCGPRPSRRTDGRGMLWIVYEFSSAPNAGYRRECAGAHRGRVDLAVVTS